MKISELPRLDSARHDAEIPVAVEGENFNVTMGQIMGASPKSIVHFNGILPRPAYVQFAQNAPLNADGIVIFDTRTGSFYLAEFSDGNIAGQTVTTWVYFSQWEGYEEIYDEDGSIREDCLFCASDGRLYIFDGVSLKSVGITEEQAMQIRHSTPIEVASEEEMQQRIALGEYEAGQLYFLAEASSSEVPSSPQLPPSILQ